MEEKLMKNKFLLYFIGWLAVVALFNLIVFITPSEIDGVSKYNVMFWVAYAFITVEFLIQLGTSAFVLNAKSSQNALYSIPLHATSYVSLVLMLIVGAVCMAVITIPDWIGIIACSVVLVIQIIGMISAQFLRGNITATEQRVKQDTMLIRMLTAEAQSLTAVTGDANMAKCVNAVYEAFRYSDPMSNYGLQQIENNIMAKFNVFATCVRTNDVMGADMSSKELLAMISERNMKCKLYK